MTREWPAEEHATGHATGHATSNATSHLIPIAWPLVILMVIAVAALTLFPGILDTLLTIFGSLDGVRALIGNPLEFLVMVVVATLFISAIVDHMAGPRDTTATTPPERALLRGIRAVGLGDDPRAVARRLRGVDLPEGRPRLCRDVAARCLERAGGCRRLDRRLRREARRWLRAAVDEYHKEMT